MARPVEAFTFEARLQRPRQPAAARWAFVRLPREASERLPRRGRTSVEGHFAGQPFRATLEPDGQLSHWLKVDPALLEAAGVVVGEVVALQLQPAKPEPEPKLPADLRRALAADAAARATWDATTTLARVDWIHWMTSAKQAATRAKRVADACAMLAGGKRRVCCFDPSGFYSKAFAAPEADEV